MSKVAMSEKDIIDQLKCSVKYIHALVKHLQDDETLDIYVEELDDLQHIAFMLELERERLERMAYNSLREYYECAMDEYRW